MKLYTFRARVPAQSRICRVEERSSPERRIFSCEGAFTNVSRSCTIRRRPLARGGYKELGARVTIYTVSRVRAIKLQMLQGRP